MTLDSVREACAPSDMRVLILPMAKGCGVEATFVRSRTPGRPSRGSSRYRIDSGMKASATKFRIGASAATGAGAGSSSSSASPVFDRSSRHSGQSDETFSSHGTTHCNTALAMTLSVAIFAHFIMESVPVITRQYADIFALLEVEQTDRACNAVVNFIRIAVIFGLYDLSSWR